jgi:hypothetical protein
MRDETIHRKRSLAAAIAIATVATVIAAPPAVAQSPYPDISGYGDVGGLQKFMAIDKLGVWFTTPVGRRCAIGDDGSFGCAGHPIPGAQHDENEVAWFPGDSLARVYRTDEPRFDSGTRQQLIQGRRVLSYRGSTCAVTVVGTVYCISGDNADSQMMVTERMTYRGRDAVPIS